jgi:hypothetical protein
MVASLNWEENSVPRLPTVSPQLVTRVADEMAPENDKSEGQSFLEHQRFYDHLGLQPNHGKKA